MPITRINEFKAREGNAEALGDFLRNLRPSILSSKGCQSCQVFQSVDAPANFVVIEIWESIDSHHESVKNIPPSLIGKIMPMLAGPPQGKNLQTLE